MDRTLWGLREHQWPLHLAAEKQQLTVTEAALAAVPMTPGPLAVMTGPLTLEVTPMALVTPAAAMHLYLLVTQAATS